MGIVRASPTDGNPIIDRRRIGAADVAVVSDGIINWAPRFNIADSEWFEARPDSDELGRVWFGLHSPIIQLGASVIIIDPCFDDPDSLWQQNISTIWPGVEIVRSLGLKHAMTDLGIAPEAVTHVLITHAHRDHCIGVAVERSGALAPRFPNARHFIGQPDWVGTPEHVEPGLELERLAVIDAHGLLETVDAEREVAPGVTMVPAPGESPGHNMIRMSSNGETCWFIGDLVHLEIEVEHIDWAPMHVDHAMLKESRDRWFPYFAQQRDILFFMHLLDKPWGRIVSTPSGYRWNPA